MSHSEELYQKLDDSERQIRLVTIEPGEWTNDIQCTLEHTSLANAKPYETLSYVWGDPTVTKGIIVNGRTFEATVNLESALRHLRRDDTPRVMWIDAICINQIDTEERSSQVSFMRDIYQQSILTVIWLGDGNEHVKSLFGLAREFLDQCPGVEPWDDKSVVFLGELTESKYGSQSLEVLVTDLLMRPWWTRAWVLQEAVVSPALLIKCGADEMPWLALWSLARALSEGFLLSLSPARFSTRGLGKVFNIEIMRDAINKKMHKFTITQLIAWNRQQRSTDPRDKIFSLLGLARGSAANAIRPDYSPHNTPLQVCLDLVKQSTEKGSLDIICMSQGSERSCWPSWVPEWDVYSSQHSEVARPLIGYFDPGVEGNDILGTVLEISPSDYNTSQSLAPRFNWPTNPPALRVAGCLVDTINRLAATYQPNREEPWSVSRPDSWGTFLTSHFEDPTDIAELSSCIHAIHEFRSSMTMKNRWSSTKGNEEPKSLSIGSLLIRVIEKARESRNGGGYVGGGSLASAYIRTLMADTLVIGERKMVSFDHIDTNDDLEDSVEKCCFIISILDTAITRATSYRRLMISSKGYIGLVPAKAQEGDLICVLFGCSVPVILRKQDDHYIFIGESYVHGIMDGEAIEQMKEGSLVEEEFTLL
ncbi:hypothetical protein ASPBRDRAFT_37887 [Aspergillus brasiliensis CBS 101740]|uniref:Heterokaryon incompatibility domain-containing protein n=1 Tax=Aspergillus brasiliensis (strain CBS 101740 / IMI 381727 / IBT 21946) TaxID=767769 RepID=A0A1L9UV70_ASPBC|nr:hypothetical protein ASPBRDRAFT_37887 [Aspergillus brasiliensis CBS 101740]